MLADLPLVDQVWNFSLVLAFIVGCLVVLVLMGPAFVRDVHAIFSGHDGPGPTDPDDACSCAAWHPASVACGTAERLLSPNEYVRERDAEIQEVQ